MEVDGSVNQTSEAVSDERDAKEADRLLTKAGEDDVPDEVGPGAAAAAVVVAVEARPAPEADGGNAASSETVPEVHDAKEADKLLADDDQDGEVQEEMIAVTTVVAVESAAGRGPVSSEGNSKFSRERDACLERVLIRAS